MLLWRHVGAYLFRKIRNTLWALGELHLNSPRLSYDTSITEKRREPNRLIATHRGSQNSFDLAETVQRVSVQSWKFVPRGRPQAVMVPKQTSVTPHGNISNQLQHESISAKNASWKSYPTRSPDMLSTRRNGRIGTCHRNLKKKHNRVRKGTFQRKLSKDEAKCQR